MTAPLRHHCRRCRLKLAEPVENPRSAFCCQGCYRQHYEKRCLVCDKPKLGRRQVHSLCRAEFRALLTHKRLGRYHPSGRVQVASAAPIKIGVSGHDKRGRGWRQIAGAPISPDELHWATLGAQRLVQPTALIKRTGPPINLIGGYKFPGAPMIKAA